MIIAVTDDRYEYIVYIADTPREMAKLTGVSSAMIRNAIFVGYKSNRPTSTGYRFYKVEDIPDADD